MKASSDVNFFRWEVRYGRIVYIIPPFLLDIDSPCHKNMYFFSSKEFYATLFFISGQQYLETVKNHTLRWVVNTDCRCRKSVTVTYPNKKVGIKTNKVISCISCLNLFCPSSDWPGIFMICRQQSVQMIWKERLVCGEN